MRTTTKKLENAVTQIKVTFDKKEWAEAQDAALKRLATRVKLDGFRPGKAPVAMIKARLGKQAIYDEATDNNETIIVTRKGQKHELIEIQNNK